jgi:hypothetical protein
MYVLKQIPKNIDIVMMTLKQSRKFTVSKDRFVLIQILNFEMTLLFEICLCYCVL